MKRKYSGKTVVITGAAGGMGRAISSRFGQAGAKLALLDVKLDVVEQLGNEFSKKNIDALALQCDVMNYESCCAAISAIKNQFGSIDVLISNAGITHRSSLLETDIQVYRKVMEVNYFGAVNCTKAALDDLVIAKGQIVVISSIAGFSPLIERSGYAASKYALHGFFDTARAELASHSVGVTIVCPGFTATGIINSALAGDGKLAQHPQTTVGKIAKPETVADKLFKAAGRDQRLLVLSGIGRATKLLMRLSPKFHEILMKRSLC